VITKPDRAVRLPGSGYGVRGRTWGEPEDRMPGQLRLDGGIGRLFDLYKIYVLAGRPGSAVAGVGGAGPFGPGVCCGATLRT
jgi:hypothetical protein